MSGVSKEGFLFVKILTGNASQVTPHIEWNRRWLQLYSNGILKCYNNYNADQLVFRLDMISLHVSVNDLKYPDGVSGKPWIISVGIKERGEKLLLEADCEECMERWAELMTQSVSTDSMNGESPAYYELMESTIETKPKGKLPLFTSSTASLDLTSHQGPTTDNNEYEIEDILTPVSNQNEVFSFGEQFTLNSESPISVMSSECFFKSPINSINQEGSSNEYEIEDLYYTDLNSGKGNGIQTIDRKSRFAVYVKSVRKSLRTTSLSSIAPAKKEVVPISVADKSVTLPAHNLGKKVPSFHSYYEVLSDTKSLSSLDSFDTQSEHDRDSMYSTINEIKIMRGNSMLIESKRRQAFTKSWSEESLNDLLRTSTCDQFNSLSGTVSNISSSDEVSFLNSLPNYHKLLCDFWLMCFLLPNGKVYKQLIDLTIPIETSLQPLLNCFQCTSKQQSHNSYLSIQVIEDLYQTYNTQKISRAEKKKGIQSLSWDKSFISQGVVTSKIVRLIMRVSADYNLNSDKLDEFLYGISHLSDNEQFCMSWVSFVKGNFPVLDTSISARHSACIFLIYKRIRSYNYPEVKNFVPSHLQKANWFLQLVAREIETIGSYSVHYLCQKFLMDIKASQSGNAIALCAKKVYMLHHKIKHDPCILTIGSKHLGIVNGIYSHRTPNPTSVHYHYRDIQGWFLNQKLNLVTLKLREGTESKDNVIINSNSLNSMDLLLKDFFQVAPFYQK